MGILLAWTLLLQDPSIDQLIERLGSDDVRIRAAAARDLRQRGMSAFASLKLAAEAPKDAEIQARAREVLGAIVGEFGRSTLRSFEDTLSNAGTLRVDSQTVQPENGARAPFSVDALLLRKTGGRIFVKSGIVVPDEAQNPRADQVWSGFLVSDGERTMLRTSSAGIGESSWGLDARDHWPTVVGATARVGSVSAASLWAYTRVEDVALQDLFRLDDWKYEEESADSPPCLEYSIRWLGKNGFQVPLPVRARVWYDPAALRPTKRLLTYQVEKRPASVLERFTYESEIPDAQFKVPEGKSR